MYIEIKNVKFINSPYYFETPGRTRFDIDEPHVEITALVQGENFSLKGEIAMVESEYVKLTGEGKLEKRIKDIILNKNIEEVKE